MQRTDSFQYKILFSRRRTISIFVSPDKGVVVKAPYRTPVGTIKRFVNEKSAWISKTLEGFNSLIKIDNPAGYGDGDTLLLFGRLHKLKLHRTDNYSVRLRDNDTIEVYLKGENNPLIIRAMLESWFNYLAQNMLTNKFREMLIKLPTFGFLPSDFIVRKMKKRWGSCSPKGKIAISYDLIRLDEKYTEYVIIHELCHLKHHNHGSGFYALLADICPDWKNLRAELKRYIR